MAETPLQAPIMHNSIGIIALDLDGTLLDSNKELSPGNLAALERAAAAGIEIVPTTGRFYDAMPAVIRQLPFVRYVITINGAEVRDLHTGQVIYQAEIPWQQAVELMGELARLADLSDELVEPVLKTVALSILTRVTAEICRGSGESGLAAFVETAGAVLALGAALPLIRAVTVLMGEMLQ